jgi:hypothetical protein
MGRNLLEIFSRYDCHFEVDSAHSIDFAQTISKLPKLKHVLFEFSARDVAKVEIMKSFAQANNLEVLRLWDFPGDSDLQVFFPLLNSLPCLRVLKLGSFLSAANTYHAAKMIEQNSSIEVLFLQSESGLSLSSIAKSLETNSKLRKIDLTEREWRGSEDRRIPFLTVLKGGQNCTLQDLVLRVCDGGGNSYDNIATEINFYLRLNKDFNRKRLLSNDEKNAATREEWINTIASANEDTAVVFYFLSENPSLLLLEANKAKDQESSGVAVQEPASKKARYD